MGRACSTPPRSVSQALSRGVCQSYWAETGPMNEIADCIENNVGEVREDVVRLVAGIPVEAKINGYSAAERVLDTREKILSAMVVYGFLSYYDGTIRIPNRELMEKFEQVLANDSMGEVKVIVEQSKEMLSATLFIILVNIVETSSISPDGFRLCHHHESVRINEGQLFLHPHAFSR